MLPVRSHGGEGLGLEWMARGVCGAFLTESGVESDIRATFIVVPSLSRSEAVGSPPQVSRQRFWIWAFTRGLSYSR